MVQGPIAVPRKEKLEITLKPAATFAGRVVSSSGEPIFEAAISLLRGRAADPGIEGLKAPKGLSDQNGEFFISGIEPDRYRISAFAPGFEWLEIPGREISGAENASDRAEGWLEIVLEPGATIEGEVTDVHGDPVLGAEVEVMRPDLSNQLWRRLLTVARTDGDGRYRLSGVSPGKRTILATHPDYRSVRRNLSISEGSQRLDLRFRRPSGAAISGQVIDERLTPIEGVAVAIVRETDRKTFSSVGDRDGRFRFEGIPDGRYRIRARHDGLIAAREDLIVNGEPITDVRLELRRGGSIRGNVLGLDIEALENARVLAHGSTSRGARVDPDSGAYQIAELAPGRWSLEALTPDGRSARSSARLDEVGQELIVDLEFGDGWLLTGEVRKGYEPLPGARIALTSTLSRARRTARADLDGLFEFTGLAEGHYELAVLTPASGSGDRHAHLLHMQELLVDAANHLTIDIDPSSLSGHVREADNAAPVSGARILLESVGGQDASTLRAWSDLDGRFAVEPLPAGFWRLEVSADGFETWIQNLGADAGQSDLELDVEMQRAEGLNLSVSHSSG
ncbi:MAG: carboxypeptidase-like regulatory domain-containing protein, partial [Acidobacteriota bacterium]